MSPHNIHKPLVTGASPQGPNKGPKALLGSPSLEMTPKTSAFKFGSDLFTRCYDTRFFIPAQGWAHGVQLLELVAFGFVAAILYGF